MTRKRQNKGGGKSPAKSRALQSQPKRKSGGFLTLAIMGGAAFIALKSCGDNSDADNDGDGVFYSSVQDCIDSGNNSQICSDAWNNAKVNFETTLPKNMTEPACIQQFSHCYYDNMEQSWIPIMGGFLLSRAIRNGKDDTYVYSSGGSSYASRPVWRTSSGDYSWRSGSSSASGHSSYTTKRVSTVSRGGYGHSSSARGSWGG